MISFAQNFEDVMLSRALKGIQNGFYIDVGAAWPDYDSVTKAFYDQGWRGINIEPNPVFHSQYAEVRAKDINLAVAIGEIPTKLMMSFVKDTGLSTLNPTVALQHSGQGRNIDEREVDVTTLAVVWNEHVPENQDVHFLKIDVEGFEAAAIRGNDWVKNRPWIVLVEATIPMSQVESYATWENVLTSADYHFAYADGLNRFYVANEHNELLDAFKYPPNVFDRFVLASQVKLESGLRESQRATQAAMHEREEAMLGKEIALSYKEQLESDKNRLELELQSVYSSKSWRLTAPLRATIGRLKSLHDIKDGQHNIFQSFRQQIRSLVYLLLRRPHVKSVAKRVLTILRNLKRSILRLASKKDSESTIDSMSLHATQVYSALQKVINDTNKRV
ncbi:FkbM family methyltransferase [Pusillimonas sp. T7-7]|uniref:FkbM family methyltransferase n=1 Tax=Pusillimonas sp. (strain T7-7) TaxID=1007105 RepID=UPI00130517A0|nr:FkbM family methyltransferase [Pusillimonas sp. T7-7]